MKQHSLLFRALVTAALGSTLVFGCDDDDDVVLPEDQVAIDANDDGFVSLAEWTPLFDQWDTDGDGGIESDEWDLPIPFDAVDTDGNGAIDEAEYEDAFNALDDNGDGLLSQNELVE